MHLALLSCNSYNNTFFPNQNYCVTNSQTSIFSLVPNLKILNYLWPESPRNCHWPLYFPYCHHARWSCRYFKQSSLVPPEYHLSTAEYCRVPLVCQCATASTSIELVLRCFIVLHEIVNRFSQVVRLNCFGKLRKHFRNPIIKLCNRRFRS